PSDDPNILYTPFGLYNKEKIPSDYSEIEIGFNFQNSQKVLFIYSERRLSSNVSVKVWGSYNYKLGVLSKEVTIIKKENNSKVYIDEQSEVKSYLEQYGITAKDLDSYYDEIVNQKVLKDWCSIYDSKYSPSNYGEVKIETQWENW
ncbi:MULTISPECIES: TipC family immunity protein, partial [Streptococcus]